MIPNSIRLMNDMKKLYNSDTKTYYYRINVEEFREVINQYQCDLVKIKRGDNWLRYHKIYCGFDIETTTTETGNTFMYKWQFSYMTEQNLQYVISGRTWEEFLQLYKLLCRRLALRENTRLVVWIANFSYEFSFLKTRIEMTDVFAKTAYNPLYAFSRGIEFRDCLSISQGGLKYLCKCWTTTQKAAGDLDYSIVRNSLTPLTDTEERYCDNDVIPLSEFSKKIFEMYLHKERYIPLTSTGILRHDLRKKAYESVHGNRQQMHDFIKSLFPQNKSDYLFIMKYLFRGGFVHANFAETGIMRYDLHGFDFKSSYPARAFKSYYPMTPFEPVKEVSLATLESYCRTHCVIFVATFTKIKAKTTHSIESKSKCITLNNPLLDNGRIRKADSMTVFLTELDFQSYKEFYTWEEIKIHNISISERGFLPRYLLDRFYYWFDKKESIDKEKNKQDYDITKTRINGHFGLSVTRLVFTDIKYSLEDGWLPVETTKSYDEMISTQVLSPYWGIYMTAHARREEISLLWKLRNYVVYSDTDSHKTPLTGEVATIIHKYNKREREINRRLCEHYGYDIKILGKIGCMEWETSPKEKGKILKFKTLGAKRYLCEYEKDGFESTISGLPKDAITKYCKDTGEDPFALFNNKMSIPYKYTRKLRPRYNDNGVMEQVTDAWGNTEKMIEYSSVTLLEQDFNLSMEEEYLNLLAYALERMVKHG